MTVTFAPATKTQAKARIALVGPSGSGKTYTALILAQALVPGGRVAVLDTEHGSASKYADLFAFETLCLTDFNPERYIEGIEAAGAAGFDVLVIDSMSHAWAGSGGALEMVDKAAARAQGNKFAGWRDVTPLHNRLVETILASPCHVIATMRSKTEYVLEENDRGKKVPRKVGMAPVQREGVDYEFDIVAELTTDLDFIVTKTRCPALSGAHYKPGGSEVAESVRVWLDDGAPPPQREDGWANDLERDKAHGPIIEILKGLPADKQAEHKAWREERGLTVPIPRSHFGEWENFVQSLVQPEPDRLPE